MKYKTNLLKNKKGSALIYVLLLLTVLTFIGTAFLTLGYNANVLALTNQKSTQARYVARSAVDTTISFLRTDLKTSQAYIPDIGNSITSDTMPSTTIGGEYKVKIERYDQKTLKITATSKYKEQTSTVSAKIEITLPTHTTANLENYTAYTKTGTDNVIKGTITKRNLIFINFNNPPLSDTGVSGLNITNLTTADFDNIPGVVDTPSTINSIWTNDTGNLDLSSGGIYKYNGNLILNRTTITIGNNDVFLFLNGNFSLAKDVNIKRLSTANTGTFFLIFTGADRALDCSNGAGAFNTGLTSTPNLMANFFVYGPDVPIRFKNKSYYQGAFISLSYNFSGSSNHTTFGSAYYNASGTSPWKTFFDYLNTQNVYILPPNQGSLVKVEWSNNVTEIPIS